MARPPTSRDPAGLLAIGLAVAGLLVTGSLVFGPQFADELLGSGSDRGAVPAVERTDADRTGASSRSPSTAAAGATRPGTPERTADGARRYRYAVREGANETTVSVYDSGRPGPTVVVVGGVHGNEPAGFRAAGDVTEWRVERGVLVVIPSANPRAVRNGTWKFEGVDLNAQFPVGERPATPQARAIWRVVERHDADVLIDLHSSSGIYGVDDGVGQAVFPTTTGDAVANADEAIGRVNAEYGLEGNLSFRRGNALGPSGRTLARKVAGDLNETAYVVETTRRGTDLGTRVEWTKATTWELLRLHGLVTGDRR